MVGGTGVGAGIGYKASSDATASTNAMSIDNIITYKWVPRTMVPRTRDYCMWRNRYVVVLARDIVECPFWIRIGF